MARAPGLVVGVFAALAAVGVAAPAAAKCAMPRMHLSPPSGTTVGPAPTLYLFAGSGVDPLVPVVRSGSRRLPTTFELVSDTGGVRAYALSIDTADAGTFDVVFDGQKSSYVVGEAPSLDVSAVPVAAEHAEVAWSCSFTNARRVYLAGATAHAYRVEHSRSLTALEANLGNVAVLPPSLDGFWHWGVGDEPLPMQGLVTLGHVSCLGGTADTSEVEGRFFLRVTPLFAEGAGHRSQIFAVDRDAVYPMGEPIEERSAEVLDTEFHCGLHVEPPIRRSSARSWTRDFWVAAIAGVLMGIAFAWARSRRRRFRHALGVGLIAVLAAAALSVLAVVVGSAGPVFAVMAVTCGALGGASLGVAVRRRHR